MITQDQLKNLAGTTAYDRDGDKIGKVGAVYYDDQTNEPTWLTVHTGLFGMNETFVPVQGAEVDGDRVTLAHDKATVKDAPNIGEDGHLPPEQEQQLYRHYGVDYGDGYTADRTTDVAGVGTADAGRHTLTDEDRVTREGVRGGVEDRVVGDRAVEDRAVDRDTVGGTTDRAMTRSEEQLRVGTETRESGRARLRKYVVTEQQNVSVPVSREEVRLEREPITEANRGDAYDGPAISEEEHEVTLHAERPVVDTEAVAVERVRLGKETVTENQTVAGEVRKEQIEMDGDGVGTERGVTGREYTDREYTDRDRDGVPDAVDGHDDRSVTEKVTDKVTGRGTDRR